MNLKLLGIWILVLGFWLLAFSIINKAYAQSSTQSPQIPNATVSSQTTNPKINNQQPTANYLNTEANVPVNLHTYTQSIFIDLASTAACILSGVDPVYPTAKCLGVNPVTHKIGYMEGGGGGAIGVLGSLITSTFYLPLNTHQYAADVASNFGLTKQTYAQEGGLGFNALLPTLTMWKTFRNITYMIFTLIFIVIGVGIMFRIKLDPRTVMGLQNTIPKIILALIFITFSYAIAGFLVDMMYVSIYVIIGIFSQQGFDTSSAVGSTPFDAIGRLGGMHDIAYGVSSSISGIVADFFSGTIGNVVGAIIGNLIGRMLPSPGGSIPVVGSITGIIGAVFGGLFGTKTVGIFAGIITYLIVMIAMVSALFRLWFMLIKCYLYVFLTTVFAPFYIVMGVLPGQSGIGGWFKGMLANLVVFPATIVMFLLGKAFITAFQVPAGELVRPFSPPLVGDFIHPDQMSAIIGLGIILLTPEIAGMVREALKVKDLSQGAAIGRSLGAGANMVSAGPKQAWKGLMREGRFQGEAGGPLRETLGQLTLEKPKTWGRILAGLGFHYKPPTR